MIDQALCAATFLAALGSGLIAGVFFAFSAFVLTALSRLPYQGGIAAMQAITAMIDGTTLVPSTPLEWQVAIEFLASITLAISRRRRRRSPLSSALPRPCAGRSRARSIFSLAACSISTSRSP